MQRLSNHSRSIGSFAAQAESSAYQHWDQLVGSVSEAMSGVNFTSSLVRNEFIQAVTNLQLEERIDFYHKIQITPSAAALRGTMFEAFIHECLSGTVKTSITRAKRVFSNHSSINSDPGEFTVLTIGKKLFNSYEDIQEGIYCQPVDRNFAAVDAIRWDIKDNVAVVRLYQMTVASRPHGFIMTPLINLIKYIASCCRIEGNKIHDSKKIIFQLITVVPVDKFEATSYQPFLTKQQRRATKIDRLLNGSNVHQYVITYDRLVRTSDIFRSIMKFDRSIVHMRGQDVWKKVGRWR